MIKYPDIKEVYKVLRDNKLGIKIRLKNMRLFTKGRDKDHFLFGMTETNPYPGYQSPANVPIITIRIHKKLFEK